MAPGNPLLLERLRQQLHTNDTWPEISANRVHAAVLLILDPHDHTLPLLFIQRSERVRTHRGQIAFPGGRADDSDNGPVATALREANEEMGLDSTAVDILGTLTPRPAAASDRIVIPVVAVLRQRFVPHPDQFEVADWFWITVDELRGADYSSVDVGGGRVIHSYAVGNRNIWGVTGRIVHEILEMIGE